MEKYEKLLKENYGYIIILVLLVLYILSKQPLVALLVAFSIVALFFYETYEGIKKNGWKKELTEIVTAIVVGVLVWYAAGFLLNTPAPLDAVVSCSMLPHLERGDMVLLRGTSINAPEVEVTSQEWEQIKEKMKTNFTCGPCKSDGDYIPYNFSLCRADCGNGCLIAINGKPVRQMSNDTLFEYNYGSCKLRSTSGDIANSLCVKSVAIKGSTFYENFSNDVVVYDPEQNSVFQGSIIHRALVKVSVDGKEYYLTKGDNNEVLDVQVPGNGTAVGQSRCLFYAEPSLENKPVSSDRVRGNVLLRIPYIGYLKLFLWGYIEDPMGCDTVIEPA